MTCIIHSFFCHQRQKLNIFIFNLCIISVFVLLILTPKTINALEVLETDPDNLKGINVKFDYEDHKEDREVALQYFLDDNKSNKVFSNTKIDDVGVYLYDIDDDGNQEIVAYINRGNKCPRAGCPFATLKKLAKEVNGKKYQIIPWGAKDRIDIMVHPNFSTKILETVTTGYHDILFFRARNSVVWKYNGDYYQ